MRYKQIREYLRRKKTKKEPKVEVTQHIEYTFDEETLRKIIEEFNSIQSRFMHGMMTTETRHIIREEVRLCLRKYIDFDDEISIKISDVAFVVYIELMPLTERADQFNKQLNLLNSI